MKQGKKDLSPDARQSTRGRPAETQTAASELTAGALRQVSDLAGDRSSARNRRRLALQLQRVVGNRRARRHLRPASGLQRQPEAPAGGGGSLESDRQQLDEIERYAEEINEFAFNNYGQLVWTVIHLLTTISLIYDNDPANEVYPIAELEQEIEAWMGLPVEEDKIDILSRACFLIRDEARDLVRGYRSDLRAIGTPGYSRPRLGSYDNKRYFVLRLVGWARDARQAVSGPAPAGGAQAPASAP